MELCSHVFGSRAAQCIYTKLEGREGEYKVSSVPYDIKLFKAAEKRAHCEVVQIVLLELRYCSHFLLLTWHCTVPSGMGQLTVR